MIRSRSNVSASVLGSVFRKRNVPLFGVAALLILVTSFAAHGQSNGGGLPGGGGSPTPTPTPSPTPAPTPAPDTWVVTYSSTANPVQITGPQGGTWSSNYGMIDQYNYGGGQTSSEPPPPGGLSIPGTGSVNCNGTITATVTWTGPDPAPSQVFIEEDTDVKWTGDKDVSTCDEGPTTQISGASVAAGPETLGGSVPGGNDTMGEKVETAYTVCNITSPSANSSFTLTVTPTANGVLPAGWSPPDGSPLPPAAKANVSYGVHVTSMAISFETPVITSGGNSRCLVGQQVKAHLSFTPDAPPTGSTNNQYNWTEAGGEPFSAYTTTTESGKVTLMTGIDTDATPVYHFRKNDLTNITCAGYIDGLPFSVPATLLIDQPTSTFTTSTGSTTADASNEVIQLINAPLLSGGNSQYWGNLFEASVTIPSPYSGTGTFYFTQLAVPDRSRTSSSSPVTTQSKKDTNFHTQYILDVSVIYGTAIPGLPPAYKTQFATGTSSTPDPNGNNVGIGDSPSQSVYDSYPSIQVGAVNGQEAFTTYLMFIPPGPNSLPVAIKSLSWWWRGTITGVFSPLTNSYIYNPSGLNQSPGQTGVACTAHPEWTGNYTDFSFQ